jgi:hypothetical protein
LIDGKRNESLVRDEYIRRNEKEMLFLLTYLYCTVVYIVQYIMLIRVVVGLRGNSAQPRLRRSEILQITCIYFGVSSIPFHRYSTYLPYGCQS